jgi:carboxyl-terminal processing protease
MRFKGKSIFLKKYTAATAAVALALLAGCSGDSEKSTPSPYLGQWYAPAYGYLLSVSVSDNIFKIEQYSVTKNYCLLQDIDSGLSLADLQQDYLLNVENEVLKEKEGDYLPGIEYEKLKQLPTICKENLLKVKRDSDYVFDAREDVEIFWETFNELYINFELRGVDWDDVYAGAISATDSIHNEEELFEFLSDIITPLGDAHAVLLRAPLTQDLDESIAAARENDDTLIFSKYTQLTLRDKLLNEYVESIESDITLTDAQIEASENYINANVEKIKNTILSYADEDSEIKVRAAGEIAWFKTRENIGYLFIGSMSDYSEVSTTDSDLVIAEAAIKEALSDLAGTDGLIIDARFNTGGEDQVALNFVRHFMSRSQVVYSKSAGSGALSTPMKQVVLNPHNDGIFLKPTAVLVSGDTVSAAEIFTIAISSLPQITIIGEPTAGALSDVLVKRLTSDILFGISNETYLDTQGNNYEGVGFLPDIAVPFATPQERKGGYDAGIDKAIEWIKTAP